MEAAATKNPLKVNRLLPYLAVFQADIKQTLSSWIYRFWVLLGLAVSGGYLFYRFGAKQVSGILQPAPETIGDLLHWFIFGSLTLVIVLTSGAICSEQGTIADSVLCRGISRHQYFLGKWHARLTVVLATFLLMSTLALGGAFFLLNSDQLTVSGSVVAVGTVAVLLVGVTSVGVSVSAMSNNTIVSIAIVWIGLYGIGFLLTLVPGSFPSPMQALSNLPDILKGIYNMQVLSRLMAGVVSLSLGMVLVGMFVFSRRDV